MRMRSVSMTPRITIVSVALVAGLAGSCSLGEFPGSPAPAMSPGAVILATTSSTYDTGLLEQLIEHFEVTGGVRV